MADIWDTKFRRDGLLEFCSFKIDAPFKVMFTAVVQEFFMGVDATDAEDDDHFTTLFQNFSACDAVASFAGEG
jgi:hypothetical protein